MDLLDGVKLLKKEQIRPSNAADYFDLQVDLSTVILAPMPGAIKNVNCKTGDMVSEGQELVVMEAMKMQNSLHAGKTGKVGRFHSFM